MAYESPLGFVFANRKTKLMARCRQRGLWNDPQYTDKTAQIKENLWKTKEKSPG
jgi:hypothetical protein